MVDEIPKNTVTIVAIIALVILGGLCLYQDINGGLILAIVTFVAGLAGYKIRDTQTQSIIKELEKTIETLKQDRN